jgi:hypothetical protein
MTRLISALSIAAFALASLPAIAADPTTPQVYALSSQNGSGEIGTVVLTPMGATTKVDVALVGGAAGVAQPDHIHVGTCAKLDPKPTYALAPVVNGVSTTVVNVPLSTLTATPFAVNVHKSAADIGTYVACGNLSVMATKM